MAFSNKFPKQNGHQILEFFHGLISSACEIVNALVLVDLRSGMLNRIEVRRVRLQEPERYIDSSDSLTDGSRLAACEIVHDHNIAGGRVRASCCSI
jgi:hypothetical protein